MPVGAGQQVGYGCFVLNTSAFQKARLARLFSNALANRRPRLVTPCGSAADWWLRPRPPARRI